MLDFDPIISPDGRAIYLFRPDSTNSYGGAYDVVFKAEQNESVFLWYEVLELPVRAGNGLVKNQFITKDGNYLVLLETTALIFCNATTGEQLVVYPMSDAVYGLNMFTNPEQTKIYLFYGDEIFRTSKIVFYSSPTCPMTTMMMTRTSH